MPAFGSFETEREIYSDPIYTVYSARKAGESGTEYAVKVFSIQRSGFDAETATDLEGLLGDIERSRLDGVGVQARGAAASKFIAPVLEQGRDERGVWYVTRFYARSVNKIISGRVALSPEALQHVIASITQGALDLKRVCGRSHGDILPSNVQISKSEKLREAEVVLSDPLPGGEGEAARYELSDLRAVGRILLQLVRQRPIGNESDFLILPILSTPEWTRIFGKDTDAWLSLCNRLLDPNLSLEQLTLEKLAAELAGLRPKPPVTRKFVIALAAALVVLGVAAALAVVFFRRGNLEVTSDPPGAEIKAQINGEYRSLGKTPLVAKRLVKGDYKLRAEYPGLAEQNDTITVAGASTRSKHFDFPYGLVKLASVPGGAEVEMNGARVGATPYASPAIKPGEQTVVLQLTGYKVVQMTILIPSNRVVVAVTTNLDRAAANSGDIEFLSKPDGAIIGEGDALLGRAPLRKTLDAGPHKITARFEDWKPLTEIVKIEPGKNPPKEFSFPYGVARFRIEPEDADLALDGKSIGHDLKQKLLPPGSHRVQATRAGYKPAEKTFEISEGKSITVEASLEPMLGFVGFTSDPAGATVFDASSPEKALGVTPLTLSFQPGGRTFGARFPGLDPVANQPADVRMGTSNHIAWVFTYATISFDTTPSGAEVRIAGGKANTPYVRRQKPGKVDYVVELPDYYPVEGATNLAAGALAQVSLRLRRQDVGIVLRSDPPGADFYLGDALLKGANDLYNVPWGEAELVAKRRRLGARTNNSVVIKPRTSNPIPPFSFAYGTLTLSNLPADITVFEGAEKVGAAADGQAFEPPGPHLYALRSSFDPAKTITNFNLLILQGRLTNLPSIGPPEIANSIGMSLVWIDRLPGTPNGKGGWVGKFEVKQKEYQDVMGDNPSSQKLGNDYPVETVNWNQAADFCAKLTARDKEKGAGRGEYKLATQTQWSFFAEGTKDSDAVLGTGVLAPAGSKPANPKGLYDVRGNVWEWLADSDAANASYIGAAYNTRLASSLAPGKVEQRARIFAEKNLGFRVVLIPSL